VGPRRIDGQAGLVRLVPRSGQCFACIAHDRVCIALRAGIDGRAGVVRVRIDRVHRRLTPGKLERIGRSPTDRQSAIMELPMVA
jgi:hypothetical protein